MANEWTAIELTEDEALVAQGRAGKAGPALIRAFRVPLPEGPAEDAAERARRRGEALRAGLRHSGATPRGAILVAPKRLVTTRYVVLPSSDDAELAQMARFEAERHIPFNAQRHTISHHVMRKEGISGSHTILAAADSPDLEETLSVAKTAGLQVEALDVSSLAQYSALLASRPQGLGEETWALLHVGSQNAEISIVARGLLIFSRSAPLGWRRLAAELSEAAQLRSPLAFDALRALDPMNPGSGLAQISPGAAEAMTGRLNDWFGRLTTEIQRSHGFAKREFDCPPVSRVYLSGDAGDWPRADERLREALHVDVSILQPFRALVPAAEGGGAAGDGGSAYVGPIGALARHWRRGSPAVDLLPPSYRDAREGLRRRRSILVTAGLAAAALVLALVLLHQISTSREERRAALQEEVDDLAPKVEELKDIENQLAIIDGYRRDKRSALAILETVCGYELVPGRVALTNMEFLKGRKLTLQGYALSLQDLDRFQHDLHEARYQEAKIFDEVRLTSQQFGQVLDPSRPQPLIRFKLDCFLPG